MNSQNLRLVWLAIGSVIGSQLIVSACSLYFHGTVTADYLITGLIASSVVAPVAIGLLSHADRRALALVQAGAEALRQSESRYRQLFDSTSDAVVLLDDRGFFDCNPASLAMFGCATREELCTKHPADLSPTNQPCGTDSLTLANQRIAMALEQGKLRFEWLHRRADTGETFPAEVLLSAVLLDGKPVLQATVRDINERKQAEDTLKKMNATLEQRVQQELSELREKDHLLIQQSRLASMGEMIGNIAHQWRQPLSVLGLSFQNMRLDYKAGTLDEPAMDHYVDDALNVVNTMSGTIDDFRHFFRPATEMVEFDLSDAIAQATGLTSASLRQHGIALQMKEICPANGCCLLAHGYPNQFSQVLLNLLTNAKDALIERNVSGGRIEIACSCGGDRATVTVSDNGGGIPDELLSKIFDPYFTTKASGSGIGLYMSKMIMDNMGGSIEAHNGSDGAEFTLTLQVAKGEETL